jgi:hypothetical protein
MNDLLPVDKPEPHHVLKPISLSWQDHRFWR